MTQSEIYTPIARCPLPTILEIGSTWMIPSQVRDV
jgi:hypothetical protein